MEPVEDFYFSRVAGALKMASGTLKMVSVPVVPEHHPSRFMANRCSSAEIKGVAG